MKFYIKESELVKIIINEIHHAFNDGLLNICHNIAEYFISNSDKIRVNYSKIFNCGELFGDVVFIVKKGDNCGYDPAYGNVWLGIDTILNSDTQRLSSLIYHEMGHNVNHTKSDTSSELRRDFESPMFLKMKNDKYKDTLKKIYRFQTRELKARCFEATMWLKRSNKKPSLEEYYSDRCTDINMMKSFLNELNSLTEENDNYDIIDSLYGKINKNFIYGRNKPPFQDMKKYVLWWFNKQFIWFKKRIDKIYYDYIQNINNFSEETME